MGKELSSLLSGISWFYFTLPALYNLCNKVILLVRQSTLKVVFCFHLQNNTLCFWICLDIMFNHCYSAQCKIFVGCGPVYFSWTSVQRKLCLIARD